MVTLSIISIADGTIPAPMMSDTACDASSSDLKAASIVFTDPGTFINLTATFVTIPKVPSDPINAPLRSYPKVSRDFPPSQTRSPSASTTSKPST